MKNTSTAKRASWIALLFATAFLTACADGDLNIEPPVPPEPQLAVIGSFQICQAGVPESCGENLTVEEGASIELVWETTDATSVEIASADGSFLASPLESSGTLLIEGVTAAMHYTLSAMTADGVAQKDVAVEVASRKVELSASMTPSKERIFEGEQVELCLSVTPEDATVKVTGDDGTVYLESMTAANAMALPCIKVAPSVTTVYTLVAQSPDGGEATITAQITVEKKIGVTLSASEVSDENKVTLSWTVTGPAPDSVDIDQSVGDVKSLTVDGKGEKEVEITADTTFTITATVAGQDPVTDSASVVMPEREIELEISVNDIPVAETMTEEPSGEKLSIEPKAASSAVAAAKQIEINAGTYFENEDVKLSWNASINGAADKITSVKLLDSAGAVVKDGLSATGSHTITVAGDGQYTLSLSGDKIREKTATIAVSVRKFAELTPSSSLIPTINMASVAVEPGDLNAMYFGAAGDLVNGKLNVLKASYSEGKILETPELLQIPFRQLFETTGDLAGSTPDLIGKFNTYPVNTIAIDGKGRMFVGSAGGFLFKEDGKDWRLLAKGLLTAGGNSGEDHISCKGKMQDAKKTGEIASLEQVCDIIIDKDGSAGVERVIVATDRMVAFLKNGVDKFLEASAKLSELCPPGKISDSACAKKLIDGGFMDSFWGGMPAAGASGNAVYQKASFDIELIKRDDGAKVLIDATETGVFISNDLGVTWEQDTATGLDQTGPVYSIGYDAKNKILYAGTDDGIYFRGLDGDEWTKAITLGTSSDVGGRVHAISVDPVQNASIYAATASGVLVSRDGGQSFKNISKEAQEVLSLTTMASADGTVGIYAATASGMAASLAKPVTIPAVAPEDSGTPEEETLPAEEQETPVEDVPTGEDGSITEEGHIVTPIDAMTNSL